MSLTYRSALPEDAAACIVLRGLTRENAVTEAELADAGITQETWGAGIESGLYPGVVAVDDGKLAGYCFGHRDTGEIVVLALLPEYEGQGVGKSVLHMTADLLRQRGFARLYLGCATDPAVRSYGFYRHLGWRSTGTIDAAGDELLEYLF
ncbi:GNAT family N-acetyltransferase [Achromobacter sp. Bel]|uniref:GNAT family N-acetyltransferase n=1 Tax=Achromobacter sp. Bel TaxID=2727415 RepID=UPI00145DC407|nr:GNAT family N-acetyltransferase [Achromobacter sp. Bel]NMK46820.1 GNAT family N-acetyltransferase [Achromobacter sp. Bel]